VSLAVSVGSGGLNEGPILLWRRPLGIRPDAAATRSASTAAVAEWSQALHAKLKPRSRDGLGGGLALE
jgi:hypothetical protein